MQNVAGDQARVIGRHRGGGSADRQRRTRVGRASVLALLCLASLAACGERNEQRVFVDSVHFRRKAKAVDKSDRLHFVVNVPKVSRSVNRASKAGRYEGNRHRIPSSCTA